MKNLFVLLVCVVMFVSCNKEDDMVVINIDKAAIMSQYPNLPVPEKQKFIDLVSSKPALKSAGGRISLVEIFPLAEETFQIFDTYVVKSYLYMEVDSDNKRKETLTVMQQFEIKNGKIVTTSYSLEYKFGCEFSKFFSIQSGDAAVWEVVCMFHFNNGNHLAYRFEGDPSSIKLPNIADGKWEIQVKTYDGDLERSLTTGLINFDQESPNLPLLVQPKSTNREVRFALNKEQLKDVTLLQFFGQNEKGEEIWFYIPFRYNESLPMTVLFALPFRPIKVVLISENSWDEYDLSEG